MWGDNNVHTLLPRLGPLLLLLQPRRLPAARAKHRTLQQGVAFNRLLTKSRGGSSRSASSRCSRSRIETQTQHYCWW